ncbi:hypothetical protein [Streptomyces hainanensis]|uniref:DUF308 domain-containing protein n=1 Tax=Streptomyces hainanensis TaxID=402648 RepID=A0A4R4T8E0_9ACTN|nr:hypothetical protein [Streptomyces hainanensis]TDC71312.1 hypothetical protein E1283_23670 [Streptomyces hainanensis]
MTERDQERGDGRDPIDEEAAWAEIVAGYGEEPVDPPGVWPKAGEVDLTDTVDRVPVAEPADGPEAGPASAGPASGPLTGPRDWEAAEDEEEDHFVPPEPPPLPETDLTTKLAWIAVLGGPLLLIVAVLLQQRMSWWIVTLGVGGFLGGFATLITRLRDGRDDDFTDPGSGAVV